MQQIYYFLNLKKGMKLRVEILGISRKNDYIEKNISYRRDLQYYTSKSLKMTIIKKFSEALGLEDGGIVNIKIESKD